MSQLAIPSRQSLEEPGTRQAVYTGLAAGILVLALSSAPFKHSFDFINTDGRWYYVYLPSLAVDGDLDFTNQIRDHWHGDWHPPLDQGITPYHTPDGLVKNKYPVGVALTLAPPFLLAHATSWVAHALTGAAWCEPDGYTVFYQLFNLIFLLALTVWGLALLDRLLTEEFGIDPRVAVLAIALYWYGSPLLWYSFREPYMSHCAGAFWVMATVWLVVKLRAGAERGELPAGRLALLACTTSMAIVCRPTNVFMVPFHAWLLLGIVRAGLLGQLLGRLPLALVGAAPILAQMLVWRVMYGRWLYYAYEEEGFNWGNPAAWQTLFSSRHGLFFWSPLLLLAIAGLGWHLRRGQRQTWPLLACFGCSFVLLWYFNSCWWCWWFGDSFGGRAFLELSAFFVLGLAGAIEAVRRGGPRTRRAFVAAVALALLYHVVLFGLYNFRVIPRGDYLL